MKKLIIANWKLNPTTLKDAQKLAASISVKAKNKVIICPPTVYLSNIKYPNVGSQDCFWQEKGAFTGQISPLQLKDLKIKYSLVGHSERRSVGESDGMVNLKLRTLLEHKITPVLCIGFGTTVDQDDLDVVDVLRSQLDVDLKDIDASKVIVAYEPVWAIGTGKIGIFIKNKYKVDKILYGGSVNVANAKEFLQQTNVGGLLIGGASLIAKDFNMIINY
jgi:triosephosphate isomerase